MRFIDTKRFQPVIHGGDVPHKYDLFHYHYLDVPNTEKAYIKFIKDNNIITDRTWWKKQEKRCREGYTVSNAIAKGGDAIRDGIDAVWIGDDVFLPHLDYKIKNKEVWISGRMYFYLNFWQIRRVNHKTGKKDIGPPRFTSLSWKNWTTRYLSEQKIKDLLWVKKRQCGLSEETACDLGYDYTFNKDSQTAIVAGEEKYSLNTFKMVKRGLERLINTQFYKWTSTNNNELIKAKYYGSEMWCRTAKDNEQVLSGLSPSKVLYEEGGIWKKGLLRSTIEFVNQSLEAEGMKVGQNVIISTAGDMEDSVVDVEHICYNPDEFNLLKFKNIYEKEASARAADVAVFIPGWEFEIVDENGNTLREKSEEKLKKDRNSKSAKERYKAIALKPFHLSELFSNVSGSYFGEEIVQHLIERKAHKYTHKSSEYSAYHKLDWVDPKDWSLGVIATEHEDGEFYIMEPPEKDNAGLVYENLYKGGCFVESEKIPTDKGLKKVEDITFQDNLINESGEHVDILRIITTLKINADVYKLKMSNTERTSTVTDEHPCLISKPKFSPNLNIDESAFDFKYIEAKDVQIGDWTRIPNLYKKENCDFDKYWIEENIRIDRKLNSPLKEKDFWWFIGLWIGDGYCSSNGKKIHIAINEKEKYIVSKLKNVCINIFGRKLQKRTRDNCIDASFSLEQLNTFLSKHFKKYSDRKSIPEWVKYLPKELKKELLLGYLDSDGCIYSDKKRNYYCLTYVSINLELLEGFQDILFSLGIISNICKLREEKVQIIRGKSIYSKKCYQLRLGHNDTLKMAELFDCKDNIKLQKIDYNNLPKTRKRPKEDCFISEDEKYIYFKIKNVTKSKYSGLVYNYECDTHTYIGKHLGCHNCDSYDKDEANESSSKGSFFIFKGFLNANKPYKKWVARLVQRPKIEEGGAYKFYENTVKLGMYYNVINLIEWSNIRIFDYYKRNHVEHLLKERPDMVISKYVQKSNTLNMYGIDPSTKPHWLSTLRDFLSVKENIQRMDDIDQLDALARFKYDPSGKKYNCDITISTALSIVCYEDEIELEAVEQDETTSGHQFGVLAYKEVNGRIVNYIR